IWVLDIEKSVAAPLTSGAGDDRTPRWSFDGKSIAFQSTRDGATNLYTRAVGVVGEDKPALKDEAVKELSDWSQDGRYLVYTASGDIWALPMAAAVKSGDSKPLQITKTPFVESLPRVSPDGHWIAYVSNEPGEDEVYVQAFPGPGEEHKVSTAGG